MSLLKEYVRRYFSKLMIFDWDPEFSSQSELYPQSQVIYFIIQCATVKKAIVHVCK